MIVIKNGKKVFPEELELYINRSPFVQESLVWSKHDEATGESILSVKIFPNMDAIKEKFKNINHTKDEIMNVIGNVIKNVNREMPIYKKIRHFSISDSEFVKTTTKKIKRHLVELS